MRKGADGKIGKQKNAKVEERIEKKELNFFLSLFSVFSFLIVFFLPLLDLFLKE